MKKYFILIIMFVLVIVCLVKVNIINTIALSPVGNFQDNFELVSDEFGEDFSEFIMDKSPVKIYLGELGDNSATVKVNEKEINLTKENPFLKMFNPIINFFKDSFSKIEERFNKNIEDNNSNAENNQDNSSELDNVVDDFINSVDGE